MPRALFLTMILGCMTLSACKPLAKSDKSFDQIRNLVAGKTAAEVTRLLGPPDTTEKLLLGDERWTWWNYTYLGGEKWAPDVRGRVVHLEITFEGPPSAGRGDGSKGLWRVSEPYGVGYSTPDDERPASTRESGLQGGP
jgi:hypothetical protein